MNTKRYIFVAVALLLGVIATVSAESVNKETVNIGYIGMSGGNEGTLDQQLYQAAVLASEELNADDDRLVAPDGTHYALQVTYYDADTESEAVDALQSAVDDEAIAVLGPQEVEFAQAIIDSGTPSVAIILGASDSPTTTDVYRAVSTYQDQANAAANYLVEERHFERIGLVGANTDVAQANLDTFRSAVDEALIVADLTHAADEEDFASDARTIRDNNVDALYISTLDAQMLALLDALHTVGWNGVVLYDGLDSAFLAKADASLVNGMYGTSNWSSATYNSASQAFVTNYTQRWGVAPSDSAVAYYDAVYMLANAIEDTGATASDVKSALNSNTFEGVQGTYTATATTASVILQVGANNQLVQAASYSDSVCANCPDYWFADTLSTSTTGSSTFTIALIAPTEGINQAEGEAMENGVKLAIREINDAGGVVGSDNTRYTLALTVYGATTSDASAKAFSDATASGAKVILGPDANGQILENLYSAEQSGTTQLVSATNPQITQDEPSNYVFQLRPNDTALVNAVADYVLNERDNTHFATVASRTDYGLDAITTFKDAVEASDDGQVVLSLEHDVNATDMKAIAEQIVNANVETVVTWTTQPAFSALWNELTALNWQGTLVYGYATDNLLASLTPSATIELLAPLNWSAEANDWISLDFTARYTDRYGIAPTAQSASYYDAVYMIANAIQANGAESTDVQAYLLELDAFTAVQGTYEPATYANGELSRSVQIVSVVDGTVHEVARYNDLTCWAGCQ